MPNQGAHAGCANGQQEASDETQQLVTRDTHLVEPTTPTRKLEFGHGPSASSNNFVVETQAWEKDIATFLMGRPHRPLPEDSLRGLQLDFSEARGTKGRQADTQSEGSSAPITAGISPCTAPRPAAQRDGADQAKEINLQGDIAYAKKSPASSSSSGATADDMGEQVLIGQELPYRNLQQVNSHLLAETPPALERGISTPCLIPTPDGYICKGGLASQTTTEFVATLPVQDLSPDEEANIIPPHVWNYQNQMPMEEVAVAATSTAAGSGLLRETIDDGCIRETQTAPSQLPVIGNMLAMEPLETAFDPSKAVDLEEGDEGREEGLAIIPLSSRPRRGSSGDTESEDAPFFQRVMTGQAEHASMPASMAASSNPRYTVGMRVEGQWGRRWFGAVVTEEEKNGYVQVRWDEDGSLLHLKSKEVRLPQKKVSSSERRSGGTSSNAAGGGDTVNGKLSRAPIMTATQLVRLLDNETPPRSGSLITGVKRLENVQDNAWVSVSMLTLYLTQSTRRCLTPAMERVLDTLLQHGTLVVECLLHLESLDAETTPLSRRQKILQGSDQKMTQQQQMCFFVVTGEDTEEEEGSIITVAHAMGVSAVSVRWLERVKVDGAWDSWRVLVPGPQDVVAQGGDTRVRWRLLPREERFLGRKLVYVSREESDISFLISVCGGTVTHQLSFDEGMSQSPDYVYVAPGKRARIAPGIASVALLERSWLIHRVYEFFLSLPPSWNGQRGDAGDNNDSFHLTHSSATKRSRLEQQGEEEQGDGVQEERRRGATLPGEQFVASPSSRTSSHGLVQTNSGAEDANSDRSDGGALEVLEGEDYYFRMTQARSSNEAPEVALGRVMRLGDGNVLMRLYEVKHTVLRQNPLTGNLDNHTTVYLGAHTKEVSVRDLIFSIPVYVVDASQMRHVYTLESPPRSSGIGASTTTTTTTSTVRSNLRAPTWKRAEGRVSPGALSTSRNTHTRAP